MIPDNACTLRITAAAGTELAGAYSVQYRQGPHSEDCFFLYKSSLQPIGQSSCTRHGWFRVASIDQYSSLLPPVGVWSVSQYQCGGIPLSGPLPIVRLGKPLPYQLANRTHSSSSTDKSLTYKTSMPNLNTMRY